MSVRGRAINVMWPSKRYWQTGIHELATLTERFAGALGNCFFTDDRSPVSESFRTINVCKKARKGPSSAVSKAPEWSDLGQGSLWLIVAQINLA